MIRNGFYRDYQENSDCELVELGGTKNNVDCNEIRKRTDTIDSDNITIILAPQEEGQSMPLNADRELFLALPKRNIRFILFITILNWTIFLYGVISTGRGRELSLLSFQPLSPDDDRWWFMTVNWWPQCDSIRNQAWRLISMQFVHSGLAHIGTIHSR